MTERDWFDDLKAVRGCQASAEVKHLLLVLHTFCRQDSCWPSMATLADCLGVGISAARRRVAAAALEGWIEIDQRFDGPRQTSNRFRLCYSRMYGEGEGGVDARGGSRARQGGASVDARGGASVDATPVTVQKELPHQQHGGAGADVIPQEIQTWAMNMANRPMWLPESKPWINAATWIKLWREYPLFPAQAWEELMRDARAKTKAGMLSNPAGFVIAQVRAMGQSQGSFSFAS